MLWGMLEEAAGHGGGHIGPSAGSSKLDYLKLRKGSQEMAERLRALGVKPGTRLGLLSDDPIEFAAFFFAVAACGSVATLGLDCVQQGQCNQIARRLSPELIVLSRAATPAARLRAQRLGRPVVVLGPEHDCSSPAPQRTSTAQSGPVLAEATATGYTLRSQADLTHEAEALVQAFELSAQERILCCLSPQRSPGLSVGLLAAVRAKAELMFLTEPSELSEIVSRIKPTFVISDCATLATSQPSEWQGEGWDSVQTALIEHSDIFEQIGRVRAAFPGKLATFYHRPETGVIAVGRATGNPDCVGHPLPSVNIWVDRSRSGSVQGAIWSFGSYVCLPGSLRMLEPQPGAVDEPGVPGQIAVSGPSIGASAAKNGLFYSDDWGYFDTDGQLHLLPRPTATRQIA